MRKTFFSYYYPTKEQFSMLWNECLFVLDTNVFLDLYRRYSPAARDDLIVNALTKIADRLWVPHQVALEYLRRRPDVILKQASMYDKAKSLLQTLCVKAQKEIEKDSSFQHHFPIDKKDFLEKIKSSLTEIDKEIDEQKQKHPDSLSNDYIVDTITSLLDGKVGTPYSSEKLKEVYEEGKTRYKNKIPPGYKDAEGSNKKEGNDKYGDLVLWLQIIDKAKESGKPIIFITNDGKEDWWWTSKGRTIGPQPELIDEMMVKANTSFYMYKSDQFIKYAQEYLDEITVKQETINEVQNVRLRDEAIQRAIASVPSTSEIMRLTEEAMLQHKVIEQAINSVPSTSEIMLRLAEEARLRSEAIQRAMEMPKAIQQAFNSAYLRSKAIQRAIASVPSTSEIMQQLIKGESQQDQEE
ncbi:DUF4935 domain-containing protein [bacterium]|nr:DUF4935 domain-containing protein [bacterium]MBU1613766.1 DUF4935 domain-containing protein [bacterium]